MSVTTDLIPSISIAAIVQARAAIMERLQSARALLLEVDAIAQNAGLATTAQMLTGGWRNAYCLTEHDAIEYAQRRLDAQGWRMLMDRSGMLALMDAKAREEWRKQLDEGERGGHGARPVPALTAEAISGTFASLHDQRGDLFERGVVEVFRGLSWDYKTNSPVKIGKRIIVSVGYWSVYNDRLDDLDRVLHVLDGKPQPDNRSSLGARVSNSRMRDQRARVETPYLAIQCHKKGTGHVTFARPDLVDQMNLIIARHYPGALPAPRQ